MLSPSPRRCPFLHREVAVMTEADFLKSILEQPDDDVTRLAFADWLMEKGDAASSARGEFIQVQIQLARRSQTDGSPADWADSARTPELKARESALLAAHKTEWARAVAPLVTDYTFHKGFIEQVTLSRALFESSAEQLFELAPIQRIRLTGGLTARVCESPLLRKLTALDFSKSYLGDHGLHMLLGSPHLTRLEWLDLSYCYLTNRGAQELADSKLLGQLHHLNLSNNSLGQQAVQSLFASPYWGKVKTLLLKGNSQIDSRAQDFLTGMLEGKADPALLRSMLHLSSREERDYTNAHVRNLAERAGKDPAAAPRILGAALGDGRRKVRSAAARMVALLGAAGVPALPKMVQRLFEQSPEMQTWMCYLANPLLSAPANLRAVLLHPKLPASVRENFAVICARRAAWWTKLGGQSTAKPVPVAKGGHPELAGLDDGVVEVLALAARHGGRRGNHRGEIYRARIKEAAWMLARLTELLQVVLPPPQPVTVSSKKGRKRV
jgi:uncharacterized protein (TIGR02996 family)